MEVAISLTDWYTGYTKASWTTQQSKATGRTCVKRLSLVRALSGFLSDQRKTFLKRNFVVLRLELHRRRNHSPRSKPCGVSTDSLVDGTDKLEEPPQSSPRPEHLHDSKMHPLSILNDMFSDVTMYSDGSNSQSTD